MKFQFLFWALLIQACSPSPVVPRKVSESLLEHTSADIFSKYFLPLPATWAWYSDLWQCSRSTHMLLLNSSLVAKDFALDQWQLFSVQQHLQEYLPQSGLNHTSTSSWRDQDYRLRLQQAMTKTREGLIPEAVQVAKQLSTSGAAYRLFSWDQWWKNAQRANPQGSEESWIKEILIELERQVGEELLRLSTDAKVLILHSTCITSAELKKYLGQSKGQQLLEAFTAVWGSDTELFSQETQGPINSLCCSLLSGGSSSSKYNSSTKSCHCSR